MLRLSASKFSRNLAPSSQKRRFTIQADPETGPEKRVYLSSRDTISGRRIVKEVGLVSASSVQTRSFGHDILARVRGFFGGEVDFYSQLLNSCNADACRRLQKEAIKAGADSVVSIRAQNSATSDPTAGVFVYANLYGTAVVTVPSENHEAAPAQLIEKDALDGVSPPKPSSRPNSPFGR